LLVAVRYSFSPSDINTAHAALIMTGLFDSAGYPFPRIRLGDSCVVAAVRAVGVYQAPRRPVALTA
jgi:hypothetical protein